MIYNLNPEKVLFLDIETVPMAEDYNALPAKFKKLWDKKSEQIRQRESESSRLKGLDLPEKLFSRSGIYAEFGKIICISVGYIRIKEFRLKSFYGEDEFELLREFAEMLEKHYSSKDSLLCAHNGKEFDYPYIARRMLINGIRLPGIINLAGKKPWEVAHLDTLELWKFGDYKSFTSLELLAAVFGVPTPKDDIDGSQVADVYYKEKNLQRIVEYCQRDTLTVAQLLLCYLGKPKIKEENIVMVQS
jgi:3'-5' exonuclease